MPGPLSKDRRIRIIDALESGQMSERAAARHFRVGVATVQRLCKLKAETDGLAPRRIGCRGGFKLAPHGETVIAQVRAHPAAPLAQHMTMLAEKGITLGRGGLDRFLRAEGLTYRERHSRPESKSVPMSPQSPKTV